MDGKIIGKALLTSTIQRLKDEDRSSTPDTMGTPSQSKKSLARTKTGLGNFHSGARIVGFDKYGTCVDRARLTCLNEREGPRQDQRDCQVSSESSDVSWEAFHDADEMFYADAIKLNDQLDKISWQENLTTKGNFEWRKQVRDSKVVFVPRAMVSLVSYVFTEDPEHSNKVGDKASSKGPAKATSVRCEIVTRLTTT